MVTGSSKELVAACSTPVFSSSSFATEAPHS